MESSLFQFFDKNQLHSFLSAFYQCVGLPVRLLDESGKLLDHLGDIPEYCESFQKYYSRDTPDYGCDRLHANASRLAMSMGNAYIFSCQSGLNHIVFPLTGHKLLLGSILVGPFLMDSPDSVFLSGLAEKCHIPTSVILEMFESCQSIPLTEPSRVTCISQLLYYMCMGLLAEKSSDFAKAQQITSQQAQIGESIQTYKENAGISSASYPYEKEKELIVKLKTGDIDQAKALLNDLLGYVFFAEGSNFEVVKSRAMELSSLLSRAAMEGGATSDSILRANNRFLKNLQEIRTLDALCFQLQETIDVFSEFMFHNHPAAGNETIRKAIRYLSRNYASPVTLAETAAQVHLNPAYFSTLFKQCTGSSFKEYLNMIRIEESRHLLSSTELSVVDIALAVGFDDQSYFSRVFKKYTGLTPKQYR